MQPVKNLSMSTGAMSTGNWSDPRRWVPSLLGVLALANLAAGWFVWQTPGGSAEALESQANDARMQVQRTGANLARLRATVKKVQTARADQERFVSRYFIDRRTASSTIVRELGESAQRSGLAPREHSFDFEPIEGSDVFSMVTISANYEGRYLDLRKFINALDRSQRFLIIEDVTAVPQQEPGKLTARFRLNAFIREGGGAPPVAPAGGQAAPGQGQAAETPAKAERTSADASLKLAGNVRVNQPRPATEITR